MDERVTSAKGNDRARNLVFGLFCSLISILFIAGIYVVRFQFFVGGLKGYEEMTAADYEGPVFPKLTDREIVNLGWAHSESDHPDSSYINFPERKRPGVVRIGTFGDSNTAGSEVAPNHDYPSFLQRRFREAGYEHVEVINFGVGSYGVHQSYLMWKTLGEKYDIDLAILLPFEMHISRDNTFIKESDSFAAIHARYVLSDDGVELVEVLGESRLDASERYFSIVPEQRYLRYDRKPPPFIRALLPSGRRLRSNPFYYHREGSGSDEIRSTYSILIERWAGEVDNLVVTTRPHDRRFYDYLDEQFSNPRIHMLESRVRKPSGSTLYRAPITHWSALGQDLRGEELFSYLTGRTNPSPRVLRLSPAKSERQQSASAAPLSGSARVSVSISGSPAASFVKRRAGGNASILGSPWTFPRPVPPPCCRHREKNFHSFPFPLC